MRLRSLAVHAFWKVGGSMKSQMISDLAIDA